MQDYSTLRRLHALFAAPDAAVRELSSWRRRYPYKAACERAAVALRRAGHLALEREVFLLASRLGVKARQDVWAWDDWREWARGVLAQALEAMETAQEAAHAR